MLRLNVVRGGWGLFRATPPGRTLVRLHFGQFFSLVIIVMFHSVFAFVLRLYKPRFEVSAGDWIAGFALYFLGQTLDVDRVL